MKKYSGLGRQNVVAWLLFVAIAILSLTPASLYVVWFFPIPIALLLVHGERRAPIVLAVLATGCLFYAGFGWSALLFGVALFYVAATISDTLKSKSLSLYPGIIVSTIVFVMAELVVLALLKYNGIDVFRSIQLLMHEQIHRDQQILGPNLALATQVADAQLAQLKLMLPGILCVVAFLLASVDMLLTRKLARRTSAHAPFLSVWYVPQPVITVYFLSLLYVLLSKSTTGTYESQVINNVMYIGGFVIGVQGIAMVWRRISKRRGAKFWLALLVAGAIVPYARFIYVLLGLIDAMNQRRQMRNL